MPRAIPTWRNINSPSFSGSAAGGIATLFGQGQRGLSDFADFTTKQTERQNELRTNADIAAIIRGEATSGDPRADQAKIQEAGLKQGTYRMLQETTQSNLLGAGIDRKVKGQDLISKTLENKYAPQKEIDRVAAAKSELDTEAASRRSSDATAALRDVQTKSAQDALDDENRAEAQRAKINTLDAERRTQFAEVADAQEITIRQKYRDGGTMSDEEIETAMAPERRALDNWVTSQHAAGQANFMEEIRNNPEFAGMTAAQLASTNAGAEDQAQRALAGEEASYNRKQDRATRTAQKASAAKASRADKLHYMVIDGDGQYAPATAEQAAGNHYSKNEMKSYLEGTLKLTNYESHEGYAERTLEHLKGNKQVFEKLIAGQIDYDQDWLSGDDNEISRTQWQAIEDAAITAGKDMKGQAEEFVRSSAAQTIDPYDPNSRVGAIGERTADDIFLAEQGEQDVPAVTGRDLVKLATTAETNEDRDQLFSSIAQGRGEAEVRMENLPTDEKYASKVRQLKASFGRLSGDPVSETRAVGGRLSVRLPAAQLTEKQLAQELIKFDRFWNELQASISATDKSEDTEARLQSLYGN